jgi:dynein heavy chain, axonemal
MMRPAEMVWSSPKVMGDLPSKRSGHSLSVVGDYCYLFGGNDFRRPPGPNNELYKLDISSNDVYWTKVENVGGRWPEPRSHHSAVVYGTKIIIFGGFRSSSMRYNDVWILDTLTDEWSQPHSGVTETKADGEVVFKRNWPDVPVQRGSHSATIIGNQMFIFGGYGGSGFARRDFNDVIALDLETWEWRNIECAGEAPDARSGHQGVAIQDSIYVIGGWNSMEQFSNVYVLDTIDNVWTKPTLEGEFGPPRWNFAAVSVVAVPNWKIFLFGGNSGDLNDGANPQGQYLNDICVLDTGSNTWSRPTVLGTLPSQRGETPIAYDVKNSRLITYGGWANRWYGDLLICKVGDVVGPSYAIESISPLIGPITGNTRCSIKGVGFRSGGNSAIVRFACAKGFFEVVGEVTSDTSIAFETPNFEKFGAQQIEVRVSVGGKPLTNSAVSFSYFSVTSCEHTVCFGPACLDDCSAEKPVTCIIQARDTANVNRVCGMDEFTIKVASVRVLRDKEIIEPLEDLDITITDQDDGTYVVNYTYPSQGLYDLSISFDGTFKGKGGPIRGSPFRVIVSEAGEDGLKNEINGPLMMESVRKLIKDTKDYSSNQLKVLKKTIGKDDMDSLLKTKEALKDIEVKKDSIDLDIDTGSIALQYFRSRGGQMDKMIEQLKNASVLWSDVQRQIPLTNNAIMPLTKVWSATLSEQMESYCKDMTNKLKEFKFRPFWKDTSSSIDARQAMKEADKFLSTERTNLALKSQICSTFDFPNLVNVGKDAFNEMISDLDEMKNFWDVYDNLQSFVNNSKSILWSEVKADELDEEAKSHVKSLKNLAKNVRWCSAYKAADKMSKDFLTTIPLISLLSAKSMQERHWLALKVVTKKDFIPPYENVNMALGNILALNLHEFTGDVEEICDQSAKELKIENTVKQLIERWSTISWIMETYKDTDIPLLKLSEEDFESLEADQLTVQSMMASRFVKQFEAEVQDVSFQIAYIINLLT